MKSSTGWTIIGTITGILVLLLTTGWMFFSIGESIGANRTMEKYLSQMEKNDTLKRMLSVESISNQRKDSIISYLTSKSLDRSISFGNSKIAMNDWLGYWLHQEVIVGGTHSGEMSLKSEDGITITGQFTSVDNSTGELEGTLSSDNKTLTGYWNNPTTGNTGTFKLRMQQQSYFEGNWALDGKILRNHVNRWTGYKSPT